MKADLYSAQHALGCCNMFAHVNLAPIQGICFPILNIQARLRLKYRQTCTYVKVTSAHLKNLLYQDSTCALHTFLMMVGHPSPKRLDRGP